MGINRLNVCAGMAGLYVIRDSFEDALNLPKGAYEIPLVIMDRMIRRDGQIYYPVTEFPRRAVGPRILRKRRYSSMVNCCPIWKSNPASTVSAC